MVRYAIDNGLNYLDTAYPYHGNGMSDKGKSEPFVAKVIKDGYREKVKIATKLPTWRIETREDMDKYLDEQLERLEIDCIDFVYPITVFTYNFMNPTYISRNYLSLASHCFYENSRKTFIIR